MRGNSETYRIIGSERTETDRVSNLLCSAVLEGHTFVCFLYFEKAFDCGALGQLVALSVRVENHRELSITVAYFMFSRAFRKVENGAEVD